VVVSVIVSCAIAWSAAAHAQRLPSEIVPSHYSLTLVPNLGAATFDGTEEISVHVSAATDTIVLNALGLEISQATGIQGDVTLPGQVTLNPNAQQATLTFAQSLRQGDARIRMRFAGTLNEQMAGFYMSKSDKRRYAVTQFEPTDARRAFPCFDEPALKATFDITAVVDVGDRAISNTPIIADKPGPAAGKHSIQFATTKRLPTYLLALLVGDFECLEDSTDGVPLRVCATPGKREQGRFALDAAKVILSFYNKYYAMPYPFEKLDLIAIPDFAAGAMENAGAIVYRESALLLDPKTASIDTKRLIAVVVAHEMAHQWFGDLVTMDWWNNVWLNEGFATWMSSKPLDAWKPEWNMPLRDIKDTESSLAIDSAASTHAIQADRANTPTEIFQLFDGITYGKTAAVLRMVEQYVGEETFRKGVNAYLMHHAFANATAEDFWTAIAEVSAKPVDQIMSRLVKQPGAPLLAVSLTCSDGHARATVQQRRFVADPARMATDSPELWTLPVCFRGPGLSTACELLSQKEQTFRFDSCPVWIIANASGRGYYRPAYDEANGTRLAAVAHDLEPSERLGFVRDAWELVRVGKKSVPEYLQTVQALGLEQAEPVTEVAWGPLEFLGNDVVAAVDRPRYRDWVRQLMAPYVAAFGREPRQGESDDVRQIRSRVLARLAIVAHDDATIRQLRGIAERYLRDPESVDSSLAGVAIEVGAMFGDATLYDQMLDALRTASTPERQTRLEYGLGGFADPSLLKRALERTLTPAVRNQDLMDPIYAGLRLPENRSLVWNFVKANYDQIQARQGSYLQTAIVGIVGALCDPGLRDDARAFFNAHPIEGAEVTLQQQFEGADTCIRFVRDQREAVGAWLRR